MGLHGYDEAWRFGRKISEKDKMKFNKIVEKLKEDNNINSELIEILENAKDMFL